MTKRIKVFKGLIIALTAEKIFQHLFLFLAFMDVLPGVGTPDIGPYFAISNSTMALLNLLFAVAFVIGLFGLIKQIKLGTIITTTIAALDIILESSFHGWLHITVSVIVSTLLITFIVIRVRATKRLKVA